MITTIEPMLSASDEYSAGKSNKAVLKNKTNLHNKETFDSREDDLSATNHIAQENNKEYDNTYPFRLINNERSVSFDESEDSNHEYDNNIQRLIQLIEGRKWSELDQFIHSNEGRNVAKLQLPQYGGDTPLHLLCNKSVNYNMRKRKVKENKLKDEEDDENPSSVCGKTFDSEELLSFEGSDDDDDHSVGSEESCNNCNDRSLLPPASVVISLLQVYPSASRCRGYRGKLPLHHVVRSQHSNKVVEAVIRAYPEALNVKDSLRRIPLDYIRDETSTMKMLLVRPISCWIQMNQDEKLEIEAEMELLALEKKMEKLNSELQISLEEERQLMEEVNYITERIDKIVDGGGVESNLVVLEEQIDNVVHDITETLKLLKESSENKLVEEEKERDFIISFNNDVIKICEDAKIQMVNLQKELDQMERQNRVAVGI